MEVIFYGHRKGNFFDKAIRWWTSPLKDKLSGKWKDSFSHVELSFKQGVMCSASQYENKVRFAATSRSDAWVRVQIKCTNEEAKRTYKFCLDQFNKPYDWFGLFGFIVPFRTQEKDKWFCSELCCEALKVGGILPTYIVSSKISPNGLYKLVTERL